MSSWFNFDFFVCWLRTQPWNLNLYKQTKCSLTARSHVPTQNSKFDWQVGLRNLKPLFTWHKILHRQFVRGKYYFRYAFIFTWKKSKWSVLKILGANFLGPGLGAGTPPIPPLDANGYDNCFHYCQHILSVFLSKLWRSMLTWALNYCHSNFGWVYVRLLFFSTKSTVIEVKLIYMSRQTCSVARLLWSGWRRGNQKFNLTLFRNGSPSFTSAHRVLIISNLIHNYCFKAFPLLLFITLLRRVFQW